MQFKAAAPLVSSLLRGLVEGANAQKKDGGCRTYIIDDSDAVGGWESDEVIFKGSRIHSSYCEKYSLNKCGQILYH